ncbi:enolase C-terminal domain-like protein [uncultured Sulfitobacter sp.]|uniref:enolase C-terminal domain-like protein n=1 Tax=uncultured Sulfitobacter sp. TaxID=191468 RepID=UPI00261529B5|nr:enolase C-terminal domain-like protein [uncultured Sulfitobacter sp.]
MMARITRISVHTHCNDLGGKVWNPAIRWTLKYAVFVVLYDAEGRSGTGECWCFDSAPDALVAFLHSEVAPHFIGESAEDVPQIAERLIARATLTARHGILMSALSGVDIAAWDLRGQTAGKPLWQLLSAHGTGDAALYASGGLYGEGKTQPMLNTEMAGMAAQGFELIKLKIGALDEEADIGRINAVLDAVPPATRLIIDGVYSYTADTALRIFDAVPHERIEAFQSPTKAWDYAGMTALSRAGVPVMATEAEYRTELHEMLVQDVQVRFLQTAPVACGGITRVMALQDLAADSDTHLSLEVSSTAVALVAACQLAAAAPTIAHVEYHTVHKALFNLLDPAPDFTKRYPPPSRAGLGIALPIAGVPEAFALCAQEAPFTDKADV